MGNRIKVKAGRLAVFLSLVLMGVSHAQLPEMSNILREKVPLFMHGLYFFAGDSGAVHVDLVHQIRYDALQFLKDHDSYTGRYELAVQVADLNGDVLTTRVFSRQVRVAYYEETLSIRDFDSATQAFMLKPGKYIFSLALTDAASKKTARREVPVKVPRISRKKLALSSLVFGERVGADSLSPGHWRAFASNLVNQGVNEIAVHFDVYSPAADSLANVQWELKGSEKKNQRKGRLPVPLTGAKTAVELPINLLGLPGGAYELKLEVRTDQGKVKSKRDLVIHIEGLSFYITDLDEAIEMLAHIADGKEVKRMKKAKGHDRLEAFLKYWEKMDPTPGTPVNEVMDEYYRRTSWANRHYGKHRKGWITDRGRIYILFGPPDEVTRRPFEMSEHPIEVWFYNRYNRDFVFIDENGYGEYRLLTENYDLYY